MPRIKAMRDRINAARPIGAHLNRKGREMSNANTLNSGLRDGDLQKHSILHKNSDDKAGLDD